MRLGSLGVVLAGAALALPAGAWAADFPPPIDKQVVQDQDDMTWSDYKAGTGHELGRSDARSRRCAS